MALRLFGDLRHRIGTPRGLTQKQITLVPRHKFRARRNLDPDQVRGDAPDFVEVGEAGIAVDDAMRRQRRVQLVGSRTWIDELQAQL